MARVARLSGFIRRETRFGCSRRIPRSSPSSWTQGGFRCRGLLWDYCAGIAERLIMGGIYRVKIHGQVLESRNLKQLLSRAVEEKRSLDRRLRMSLRSRSCWYSSIIGVAVENRGVPMEGEPSY